MFKIRQILPILALVFILGLTLGSCSKLKKGEGVAMQIQLTADPVTLDPAFAEDGVSFKVLSNVLEGLLSYDGAGNLRNALAESYTISPDQKKFRFVIRPRAAWSDGQPVLASQFVSAFRRVLAPGNGSKLAALFEVIRGAKDFRSGKATPESLGVKALDDRLLEITLERPTSYFLGLLTLMTASPFREDQLNFGKWKENGPSTGSYKIGHRRLDDVIVLEPNPYWWGSLEKTRLTYPPVVFRIVKEDSTALSLFSAGQLDVLTRVSPLDQPKLKEQGVLRVDPFYATYYLSFNTRKSPFTDVRVRRAIAAATQPREIIAALGSDDVPARSLVPVGLEGFEKYVDQPSGPSEIEVAWVKQSVGAKKVVAGYDANSRNSLILQKLQNDFKQKLGLTLELQSMDWKAYLQMLGTDAPALFRFGWLAPFKDPIVFFKAFQTGNPNNYTGWSNPRYDSIVSELEIQKPESERRRQLLAEAQKILIEQDAVVVPLYHYMQVHAIGPRVRNFRTNSFGVVRYDELELVRTAK